MGFSMSETANLFSPWNIFLFLWFLWFVHYSYTHIEFLPMLCGLWILLPPPEAETVLPVAAARVLTAELPGNSICFFLIYCCSFISFLRWKLIFLFSSFRLVSNPLSWVQAIYFPFPSFFFFFNFLAVLNDVMNIVNDRL